MDFAFLFSLFFFVPGPANTKLELPSPAEPEGWSIFLPELFKKIACARALSQHIASPQASTQHSTRPIRQTECPRNRRTVLLDKSDSGEDSHFDFQMASP